MPQEFKNLPFNQKLIKFLKKEGVILAYLFGSQITGFTHDESDVDLAILLSKNIKPAQYFRKSLKLGNFLSELFSKKSVRVVVLNEAAPLLKHVVVKEGKLLYQKNDLTRINFEMQTLHEYEDMKHFDNVYNYYMSQRIKEGTFGKPISDEEGKHD